jgi:hypothetical protein
MRLRAHQVVKDRRFGSGPAQTIARPATFAARRTLRQFRTQVFSRLDVPTLADRILSVTAGFRQPFVAIFFSRDRDNRPFRCGEEGIRTPDPLLAKQVLYQLSYSPADLRFRSHRVRVLGFEPRTSALSELRSSQLSYTRVVRSQSRPPVKCKSQTFRVWLSSGNGIRRELLLIDCVFRNLVRGNVCSHMRYFLGSQILSGESPASSQGPDPARIRCRTNPIFPRNPSKKRPTGSFDFFPAGRGIIPFHGTPAAIAGSLRRSGEAPPRRSKVGFRSGG